MRRGPKPFVLAAALAVFVACATLADPAAANTFSNTASIGLRDPNTGVSPTCSGGNCATAAPYPSNIPVSGLSGTVTGVTLSLNNVSYAFSDDIDALLVGPGNQSLIVVAAVGPNGGAAEAADHSTLTISDAGMLPTDLTAWGTASTFKPANFGSFGLGNSVNGFNETYISPAPQAAWGDPGQHGTNATLASIFNGTSPNGTWSLYVLTTSSGDGIGAIAGGWTLNITTAAALAPTTTTISSSNNPSFTSSPGNSTTLTATVHKTSDNSNVNEGTVAFTDGGVTIPGCGAVSVSAGNASCTNSFTTEGTHAITATYSGTSNFGLSSNTVSQVVNNHTTVNGSSFCNTGSIALNNPTTPPADATPYPSNLFVSGLSGTVNHVTVTLNNAMYNFSQDIDALLVGPGGQTLILVANLGPNSGAGAAVSNGTLTFSDAGVLPGSGMLTPWSSLSTIKPVNYGGFNEMWGPPAPMGPYGDPGTAGTGATLASKFNGINGNGTWSLYVITTGAGDGAGAIGGGWCANITAAAAAGTTTTVTSDDNPSFTTSPNNSVTFTANVTKTSDSSNVGEGTVRFTDGGTAIPGCTAVAVSASGVAQCSSAFTVEGNHPILAQYNGTTNFGPSNNGLTQVVVNHTQVTGNSYCNQGPITLNNPPSTVADATPYPSDIFVTGRPGALQHLTVTLNNATYGHSQDIDALLVGPGGQTFILVAAAGPNTGGISNVTLTLDDSATSTLAQNAIWGAPNATVTSKPVNYVGLNEVWGPPAPAGPYGNPGPAGGGTATLGGTFNGASPNGTWSLYLITTAAGDGTGSVAGGWCLGLTSPAPPTLTKSFGAPAIPQGGSTSLSFTASNPNTNGSLTGVGFTDTLPAGLAVATPNGLTGTCGSVGAIAAAATATSISFSGATLAAGASCTFSVNVTASSAGAKVNTTSAPTSTEGGSGTAATATLGVVAPPSLAKSFVAATVPLNGSTILILTLTNPNATVSLSGVGYTDTLPAGVVVATNNMLSQNCILPGAISAVPGSSLVSLSGATLAANASCTISLAVTGTTAGAKVNTTSAVSSNEGGSGAAAKATLTVLAPPVIAKAFAPSSISLNGTSTLTFRLTNPNPADELDGVAFTDTFPAGLVVATPSGATSTCANVNGTATPGSGGVSANTILLPAGGSCTFTVNVTGTTSGAKNNSVTVTSTNGGTGNTATASLNVAGAPQIVKSFGAATIPVGGSTSLSFTVTNPAGNGTETGIAFTDTLPAGVVVASPNGLSGSCSPGTITAAAGATAVGLSGATLADGASCTFSVNVTGTSAGVKNNSVTVSSTEGGTGNTSNASLTVVAPPMLAKSFVPATVPLNGSTILILTLTNPNATVSLSGVGYTDTLPAGLVVATNNMLSQNCILPGAISAVPGSSLVSLSGATLAANASCTISLAVTGTTAGAKVNTTSAVSSTEGGSGAAAKATLTVLAPPVIAKAFAPSSISLNGTSTLTFRLTNPNPADELDGVAFTDTFPAGLVVATPSGATSTCANVNGTATAGSGGVSANTILLPAGGSCTFAVNVTGTTSGAKNNSVTVTSTNGGTGNTATASLNVAGAPQIVKSFGAATIPVGGSTSLSFTVTNPAGNGTETGIAFSDTLPAGVVVASPNGLSGSCSPGTITAAAGATAVGLSGATLADGASCTFAVNVTGTSAGVKNNSVTVSSTEGGTGNTSNASLTVVAPPTLTKAFGAASVPLGGTTSLRFTAGNPNATTSLTGVGFTDTLPAGLTVATPNGLSGSCGVGTITAAAGSGSVSLSGATLTASGSCTFSVNVTGTTAGAKVNTTSAVSSTEGGSGAAAKATLTVLAPPVIAKAFAPSSISLNGTSTLTFRLTNPNPADELDGVAFTDTFPAGLVVASPSGATSTCANVNGTATPGSGGVSANTILLPAGGSCTFTVNVTGTTSGAKNNSVTVTSTNGGTGNTATASLNVAGAPQIVKSFGAATIPVGGSTSLSFTVTNPAGNGTETGIAFSDTLPAGVVVASPNGLSGSCSPGTITAAAGATAVGLSGATLADGASCTFAVNVTGTSAGVKNNSVTVSSTEGGTGNTSNASLTVVAPPVLTKAFGAATIPLNGTTSLTFTASNPNATTGLTGVGFSDPLPAGLRVATPTGLTGSCGGTITATPGATSVSLSGATLTASGSCTFSVNVTGTSAGAKVNTTSAVSSTEGGSGAAAKATLTVLAPPVIAKAFAPSSISLNGTSTLTFRLTNPNPADELDGVAFTDTFPAGLVVATPSGATSTCANVNGTATAGSGGVSANTILLPAGGSCTFAVNVTGTTSGAKNNSVTVTSTNGGTGNTATASLNVAGAPQIVKSFGAATIPVGGSTSLSFTVTNPAGNGTETGIAFSDTLPAGVVVASPNGLSGSCSPGTITAAAGATAVGLSGATLADGASCTFAVNVTGTSAGVKNNSVTVSSTEGGTGNTSNASLTVVAPPTLTKAFGAASVPLGGTTSLRFTAGNPNATTSLTGVGFTDTLPAGLTVATPNGLSGSCGVGTITAAAGSGSVSLSGATLTASGSCTFSVNVTGTSAGAKVNTTSAVSSTEGGSGAAAKATLTVLAPPVIAKAFAPSSISLNGTSTLTFRLTNPNPADELDGVAFTDTFPAGLVVATPSGATSTCANFNGTATPGSGGVSANTILLPAGGSCTFTVNVTPTTVGVKNNSVTVSSTNGGTGNTATASLTTAMPPQIAKAFGAATIPQGGQTSLGFTITNPAGNIGLTGVAFTDTLPAGMTVATPNGLSGGCGVGTITATAGSGKVSLAGAGLAPGAVCTFAVNVTSATVGAANNSVSVTASESGPGNTVTASLTVVAPPTITKAFGAATIPLGGQTSLSFTVGNPAGNLQLTGVGFTDSLPAGLVVATPPGVTGSCGGTVTAAAGSPSISLTGASISAGTTCTFSVNVTGTAPGTQKNSVTASSDNGGSSTKADASVTVVAPPALAKSFGSPTIPFGTSTSLSFTVTNPNAATPLSGVGFTDTLPAGLIVATPNGLTGTCGPGTITAAAGSTAIGLSGATLLAGASCTFAVNVTATAVGPQHNTTSTVSSNEGGSGAPATADVTVGRAPTTTTVTATPPSVAFGSPVTFTATVAPAQSNGSGTTPTGTVSFFVDGSSTAAATVALSGGQAAYTVSGLGAGSHTVVAVYNGDQSFLGSTSSPGTPVAVTCATTVTGTRAGTFIPGAGATCIAASAHLTGGVIIHAGSAVDFEGAQIDGSIDASAGPSAFRLCGSTVGGALLVAGATGFVLVGDPDDDACPSNTIRGSLSLKNNTHGLDAIGNHVAGSITITGNSGAGPFAQDTGPEISGNGP